MSAPTTTARRVTPTAVRVLPADADRDTWLAARRAGIGSSDVAAIVGASTYATPLHVYHDKRGSLVDEPPSEPMLWGSLLEDTVAREWARRNRSVIQRVGLIAHQEHPWMLATLDRRVLECPLNRSDREACALEVKCRNAFTAHRWRADVPDDVLAQTVWQMEVTGYSHVHVAVLIGGSDYRQTVVRRDADLAGYVLGEVARFRRDCLEAAVPPVVEATDGTATALLDLDKALHTDRVGEIDVDDAADVHEYARLSAAAGAAKRRLEAARARLAQLADGRQLVLVAGHPAYEYTEVSRTNCDLSRLAEHHPDAYADCVTTSTHYAIRIAPDYRVRSSTDDQ